MSAVTMVFPQMRAETKMQRELKNVLGELQIMTSIIQREEWVIGLLKEQQKSTANSLTVPFRIAIEDVLCKLEYYRSEIENLALTAKNTQDDV